SLEGTTKVATMATSKRERQKVARREKLERMQRYDKRRKNLRRSVIVTIIAVLVIGTGALLFAGGKSPATTTTTSTTTTSSSSTTSSTTASTPTTLPAAGQVTQAQANAIAVAAGCPASTAARVNTLTWSKSPAM